MDAAEYKHLVLGLIFLKYISDTFVEQQQKVLVTVSNPESDYYLGDDPADHQEALEDRDYYTQENVFWAPADARWESLRNQAKQPDIGQLIDRALVSIENENPTLRGKLDKRFVLPNWNQGRGWVNWWTSSPPSGLAKGSSQAMSWRGLRIFPRSVRQC